MSPDDRSPDLSFSRRFGERGPEAEARSPRAGLRLPRSLAVVALAWAVGLPACPRARASVATPAGAPDDSSFFDVQRERLASERQAVESGWSGALGVGFGSGTFQGEAIPVLFSFGATLEKRFLGRLGVDLGGNLDAGSDLSAGSQSLTGFGVSTGLPVFLLDCPEYDVSIGPRLEWSRDSWTTASGSALLAQRRAGVAAGLRISSFMARFEYDPYGTISGAALTATPSFSLSFVFWDPLRL